MTSETHTSLSPLLAVTLTGAKRATRADTVLAITVYADRSANPRA